MAKITTKNASELARIKTTVKATPAGSLATYLWVLRTDGKVLRRLTGEVSTGYSIFGKAKTVPTTKDEGVRLLERVATKRGHEVVR